MARTERRLKPTRRSRQAHTEGKGRSRQPRRRLQQPRFRRCILRIRCSSQGSFQSRVCYQQCRLGCHGAEPTASKVADKISKTVEQVNTLNNAAQKLVDAASAATDTVKGSTEKNKKSEGDIPFDSVEDVIMSTNADHLLQSLAPYLGEVTPGGAAAWKKEFGAQVEQARQAARDAILNAPNKEAAQQIALGAEKWLLEAVKFDEEKLGRGEDSTEDEFEGQLKLSIEQKKKLNEMGKTLRKRIASREAALKKKEKAEKKKEKTHDEL